MTRHGWFEIPGVQTGDRTLADQKLGLEPALTEIQLARSAGTPWSVADLGCAEGLITRECMLAGAASVLGVESVAGHLDVARLVVADFAEHVVFVHRGLQPHAEGELAHQSAMRRFDLVLSLGVCHKLTEPAIGLRYSARAARYLLCFRNKGGSDASGEVRGKHSRRAADAWKIFAEEGLVLEKVCASSRNEAVEYWRRQR